MKTIRQVMQERVLCLDGGMGTQIFANNPTVDDYGGTDLEGCVEILNERRSEWIQTIHNNYFTAGADAVETNTFGCTELVLAEFGLGHRTEELNILAVKNARDVALSFNEPKFVIGSVGPGTKLLTLLHVDYPTLYRSYCSQMRGLIIGGADAILVETSQDIAQVKLAVRAAKNVMKELKKEVPIWVQVTIETTGSMLVGTDIQAALTAVEMLGVDVMGMNCATGPAEMRQHIAWLSEASPFAVSCLPNAGLPQNVGGKAVFPLGPVDFAGHVFEMAKDFGLNVVGGCCGTTPAHIRELAPRVKNLPAPKRKARFERSVSSLYNAVPLDLEPKPLFVGERTNANGSKKFRDELAANNWDGLVQIARSQLKEGAHVLDVCVAYVGRNEVEDMSEFLKRLVTQVNIPLMIDSTESPVIERALQLSPGKCIVNSINLEDGEEKARTVLGYCKEYGASVVALTIDELGMAKTLERKLEVAQRLYDLAVGAYGLNPGDLIFDPLTFTLGSGDEEFRKAGVNTLDAIREIKSRFPGVRTILGLSNISFGLNPWCRQILNSLMLYHAVKYGLDMAILNAAKIVPFSKIDPEARQLFEDLIFDNRREGYDPLKLILQKYSEVKKSTVENQSARDSLPIEEKLKLDIIDGEKALVGAHCLEALQKYSPLEIINTILLDGMKTVGIRFGAGEMQLPFVLESAEAMKAAVATLEPHMEKIEGYTKGRMILATVKGDVHDIGKNLVEIILSNNGYQVLNLGIKQPIETILEKFQTEGADAIGLSGLLVKSTAIMKDNLEYMSQRGLKVPVVLGGAALTRQFVEEDCQKAYGAPVFYAGDAFEGLKLMELISESKRSGVPLDADAIRAAARPQEASAPESGIQVIRRGDGAVPLTASGQSSWVQPQNTLPVPPFFGVREVEADLETLFQYLDEFALIRSRWGFTQGKQSPEEFQKILEEKALPLFDRLKKQVLTQTLFTPKALYGYFPACSKGDTILVYAPGTDSSTPALQRQVVARFDLPRQAQGRRQCISDFLASEDSGLVDTLPLQVVTLGEAFSQTTAQLYDTGQYSEYFYLHGLGTELTEAYAEWLHKRIRHELGAGGRDASDLRKLFSQGYQGSRYSFGYPACPDLEGNQPLLELLGAERIGIALSENFQMVPELSTCALVITHPQARYFSI